MKKSVISVIVVVVVVAAAIGGYLVGTHKNDGTNTVSSVQPSNTKTTSNTSDDSKLDLNSILANLQKQYPTVKQTYVYTESRDPNGNLGKAGYYTAGAEFYDTRTDTEPDGSAFGTDSGGAIEVYANDSDAAKRVSYLQQFQGGTLDPGAFKQVGRVVVRASSQYTASQQKQMINYLASRVQQ